MSSNLVRASLAIEEDLLERFDRSIERSGHGNRSEAVRDLIRAHLLEASWGEGTTNALASVTLIYDHRRRNLARQIEEHGHAHHDAIVSSMHIHLSPHLCMEVVVLRGEPTELRQVADHLIGLPGVLHGQAVYSCADLAEALA